MLLVDGEPDAARMLAKGLREHSYAVDIAVDGKAALYQSCIADYDAVVLELRLPDLEGFEVCRGLRRRGSSIPVLILSARDTIEDRIAGLDCGADDYLTKPYAFGELLARLRAVTRRAALPPPVPILEVGELRIDRAARQVFRRHIPIALTAREYALLAYLAERAGTVVARTAIVEHVWDEHHDPLSNVIDVHIQRLRRKVDVANAASFIRTHRGKGYELRHRNR